mgnify:CR=1 FL=1
MNFTKRFYERLLRGEPLGKTSWVNFRESDFRWTSCLILCFVMLAMVLLSLLLNWYEGHSHLFAPLAASLPGPLLSLLWLKFRPRSPMLPTFVLVGSLMVLGIVLLVGGGAPHSSSLLWFIMFPPMVMFCAGLRSGTILFAIFFGAIALLLFTPLNFLLAAPLEFSLSMRFMLVLFGSFLFSWFAEYTRFYTRKALVEAMSRMEQDALTDPLTGLGNRRDFQHYFSWVSGKSARDQQAFSIAMSDIDNFKKVNDTFGHEVGDKVLVHISGIITTQMRAMDRLFRWGGEEFLLLMPETGGREAVLAAERMRRSVAESPYVNGDTVLHCTISVGLYSGGGLEKVNEQIAEADRNLYSAKSGGRNMVVG